MSRAFLDTTILVDILLKPKSEESEKAQKALRSFTGADVHGYAIKELKAGPLRNFAWMHNKLRQTGSYYRALTALQRMSLTPRRYTTATALEALKTAAQSMTRTLGELTEKYGSKAKPDFVLADRYRLALSHRISRAWRSRFDFAKPVYPLVCYREIAPFKDKFGDIEVKPTECRLNDRECCMGTELRANKDRLTLMRAAILARGRGGLEDQRKTKAIKEILKKHVNVDEKLCRALGDVVFALFAPENSVVLTTNGRDHKILLEALGKKLHVPE